jgi:hypothetical protein
MENRGFQSSIHDRFEKLVLKIPMTDCHLWIGAVDKSGYGGFSVKTRESKRAHQVSFNLFKGEIPEGAHVLHNCDNKLCVNPDHLRLGVHRDNMKDWSTRGDFKATPEVVKEIRNDLDNGLSLTLVAKKHGLSKSYLSQINSKKRRLYV